MQDDQIIALYWARDHAAISHTQQKYGRCLSQIAYRILYDREDSKESVNDTYLQAWNSIPPHRPHALFAYLGKITRQIAIDKYRKKTAQKRRASTYALSLEELGDCVSTGDTTVSSVDLRLLAEAIGAFLRALSPETRIAFIGRYFFLDSIRKIALYSGSSESKIKSLLYRTRLQLKDYLKREGFDL